MSKVFDLTEGSIFKKLVFIALPVLLTSISQMAYNLTDMFWIGRVDEIGLNETSAISAIGTAGYLTWFGFGIILIAKIGTSVKVAHSVGEKDLNKVSRFASNGLLLETILGLTYSLILFIFKKQIIALFNISSEEVVRYALTYLSIVGSFLVFQFVVSGFAAINEGLGKTKLNFNIMVIGLVLNMILDPILIIVFRKGVAGAAIATVISQGITLAVFLLIHILDKNRLYHFRLKAWDFHAMKEIIRVGLPAGVQSVFFTVISMGIARMVFVYGEDVMASQRIGSQIEQFTWMIAGGFQTALTVFVGQNFGAKQFSRIRSGMRYISLLLLPYALLISLILYFKAEFLMRIFLDDPNPIGYGIAYLKIISIAQIFMMLEGIGSGLFNGVGKTNIPSIVGIVGNLLRIPLALFLSITLFEEGIWWSLNISDIFKGGFLLIGALYLLKNLEQIKPKKITFKSA